MGIKEEMNKEEQKMKKKEKEIADKIARDYALGSVPVDTRYPGGTSVRSKDKDHRIKYSVSVEDIDRLGAREEIRN